MDGIARVPVESHVMEYIMHCMYTTFVKIQKGLHVAISWHRDDDTVMITSTQRSVAKDLHHALNRFFILYNTVKRNLTFEYCVVLGSPHNLLFVTNQLAEKYRRIYIEKARNKFEIKLWGFKAEIDRAIRYVRQIAQRDSSRLETPFSDYVKQQERSPRKRHAVKYGSFLPRVDGAEEPNYIRMGSWVHEPTIFENQLNESLRDILPDQDSSHVVYSKSFEKKLSELKYGQSNRRDMKAPSRYSTSEMKRANEKTKQPKKTSTFPKLIPDTRAKKQYFETDQNQIQTPTGLIISCRLRDEEFPDHGQVLVTEISRNGRLSEEVSWMVAKERAHEITRVLKLHVSLYGELVPSKVIVTPGFQLRYKQLIHVTPPSWEEERVQKSLRQLLSTYKNIFRIADSDIKTDRLSIPILGRCSTAAKVFPELVALSLMNQAIIRSTKAGFGTLRHVRILCSRQSELEYVKAKLFNQVMALQYDPRYLRQQRMNFLGNDRILTEKSHSEEGHVTADGQTYLRARVSGNSKR